MKTITIIFVGLIAHVNQPYSLENTAVLPRDEHHFAQMRIPAHAVLNTRDEWVEQFEYDDEYLIPLEDRRVRLNGTAGMFCDKDSIANVVPSLKKFAPSCGDLKKAVRDRRITSKLAAFVDYRAGRMTVESYFKDMLLYPDGSKGCSACRVRYDANLERDEAVFVFTDPDGSIHELRVAGNNYVLIENMPHWDAPSGHFPIHFAILNDCDDGPEPTVLGSPCRQPNICKEELSEEELLRHRARGNVGVLIPLADCTNSQYP